MKAAAARPRDSGGRPAALLLGLLAALLPGRSSGAAVTPLQKVVQMLQGMIEAGKDEKHEEQLQYAVFERFCIDTSAEKDRSIKQADSQLELLRAEIQKHGTEAERLAVEIRGHEGKTTSLENDTEAAAAVRAAERSDYEAMHQNYSESIHALTEAIAHLKRTAYGKKDGDTALVQRVLPALSRLPASSTRAIAAFLEGGSDEPDDAAFGAAPEATPYEFQSGDVVKMLEQLLDKFRDEIADLEKQETSRRHAFNMLDQDLKNSISVEQAAIASKGKSRSRHLQLSMELTADEKDTAATRADDAAYLQDLQATCKQKEDEYNTRQQLRSEELTTLEKAISILSSSEVAGAAEKHLPALLQVRRLEGAPTVLAQLRSAAPGAELLRVADFLRAESARLNSHVLSSIAMHAQDDPFAKVKKLIEELLERLMTQATAEAEHKGWCNTELATNEHTRKTKSEEVEVTRAEIDDLEAAVAQLKKEVTTLTAEVAEINAEVSNATAIRNEEKASNANTTAEAQQAQAAVTKAVQLLKDFYGAAAKNASSFAQGAAEGRRRASQEPPPIFGEEKYAGQQAASGGILGMLEVIHSDFVRLESDTATAEAEAEKAHRKFLTDSGVAKAQKEVDIKHKTTDSQSKELTLTDKRRSLEDAEQILAGALAEYEKLKPACINTGQTYEERVQRREEEIEALKKALEILSDVSVA